MTAEHDTYRAFWRKHALGPLAAPSCICCGRSTQGEQPAVQHMELPGIVVCKRCKDASATPSQSETRQPEPAPDVLAMAEEAKRLCNVLCALYHKQGAEFSHQRMRDAIDLIRAHDAAIDRLAARAQEGDPE